MDGASHRQVVHKNGKWHTHVVPTQFKSHFVSLSLSLCALRCRFIKLVCKLIELSLTSELRLLPLSPYTVSTLVYIICLGTCHHYHFWGKDWKVLPPPPPSQRPLQYTNTNNIYHISYQSKAILFVDLLIQNSTGDIDTHTHIYTYI